MACGLYGMGSGRPALEVGVDGQPVDLLLSTDLKTRDEDEEDEVQRIT